MKYAILSLSGILVSVFLMTGCDFSDTDEPSSALDERLRAQLIEAADDSGLPSGSSPGLAFFRLPDPGDYAALPQDPRNLLTPEKVALGRLLFHETGLLTNPARPEGEFTASCASCHHVAAGFQAGRIQGIGEGGTGFGTRGEARTRHDDYALADLDVQPIRSPSAMNGAYQHVMLWNGQFGATGLNTGTEAAWTTDTPKETNHLGYEGLETQAIAALAVHRMDHIEISVAATLPDYQTLFAQAFPGQPIDREHAGLAIAAYERTLLADEAPFQQWLRGETGAMTEAQKSGALLFFGKAGCVSCHTGPALNSMSFHALGMEDMNGPGVFLDGNNDLARPEHLGRGGFTGLPEDDYKFKTPQLYNLVDSPFLGHGGTFSSVRAVIEYKNRAVAENTQVPPEQLAEEFVPLGLNTSEVTDLTLFIEEALYDPNLIRYVPEALPSGHCFPVNDTRARDDLGC